jgi:hypothetical protein
MPCFDMIPGSLLQMGLAVCRQPRRITSLLDGTRKCFSAAGWSLHLSLETTHRRWEMRIPGHTSTQGTIEARLQRVMDNQVPRRLQGTLQRRLKSPIVRAGDFRLIGAVLV